MARRGGLEGEFSMSCDIVVTPTASRDGEEGDRDIDEPPTAWRHGLFVPNEGEQGIWQFTIIHG